MGHRDADPLTVTVRLFAAARDAAGAAQLEIAVSSGDLRVQGVLDLMLARAPRTDGRLADVLPRCSYLLDGLHADVATSVLAGSTLDVLPPFAGG